MAYDPDKGLLSQDFFEGGPATPEKLQSLVKAIFDKVDDPDALALLSGCAVNYLLAFARTLEKKANG